MNIKTFGSVDERSFKQLERCMAAGDADYGVLCTDHHPASLVSFTRVSAARLTGDRSAIL